MSKTDSIYYEDVKKDKCFDPQCVFLPKKNEIFLQKPNYVLRDTNVPLSDFIQL